MRGLVASSALGLMWALYYFARPPVGRCEDELARLRLENARLQAQLRWCGASASASAQPTPNATSIPWEDDASPTRRVRSAGVQPRSVVVDRRLTEGGSSGGGASGGVAFQRAADVMGVASTFESGDGLPTSSFVLQFVMLQLRMLSRSFPVMMDFALAFYLDESNSLVVSLDSTTYFFDLLTVTGLSWSELLSRWSTAATACYTYLVLQRVDHMSRRECLLQEVSRRACSAKRCHA